MSTARTSIGFGPVSDDREPIAAVRRHMPMRRLTVLLAFALVTAACSIESGAGAPGVDSDSPSGTTSSEPSATEPTSAVGDTSADREESDLPLPPTSGPPDVVVKGDGGESRSLTPISYCWADSTGIGVCADGMPVEPYPVLSAARSFTIEWPVDGWVWSVSSAGGAGFCSPTQQVLGVVAGDPVEVPNGAQISIFGRGPGGDAWFVFASDFADPVGSVPMQASLGWAAPAEQLPEHSHLWLNLANVGDEPQQVDVGAVVHSGDRAVALDLTSEWNPDCWNGSLSAYTDPGRQPEDLAGLEPPFVVDVTIRIDGRSYVAAPITWPDDFPAGTDEGPVLSLTEVEG